MSPIALTIAGSDSGGGAGIQADLKTFSALGVYGCSVITALTAQNTQGVQGVLDIDPAFVRQQLQSVFSDLDIRAVKIGMLSNAAIIETVVSAIAQFRPTTLVVDPVMVATSGDRLLKAPAVDCLRQRLLPGATLITPNLAEAAVLLDQAIPTDLAGMEAMVEPLLALGCQAVLLKGGHLSGDQAIDLFYDGQTLHRLSAPRVATGNTHGTGCTLSAAVAALLARGQPLAQAVSGAKAYLSAALARADQLAIGCGHGPVHHFHQSW